MHFEFATATRIVFGSGKLAALPELVSPFGRRAFVVTGSDPCRAAKALAALDRHGIETESFSVCGEPTVEVVRHGALLARKYDFVIGFGGGSAIDAGKAIAALATNSGEPLDYLEVIGRANPLEHTPLPFVALPTTAGTGAEVTRNAVIGSSQHQVKASLRSPLMLAKVALADPELTVDVPPHLTASTGLDTLTQLIEPFVSSRANPLTDVLCVDGISRVVNSLFSAFESGRDLKAREDMAFASLLSGLALANAGLGVVHGFAAALGGMLNAPHGALCAAVLPHGIRVNIEALRHRAPNHPALDKYRRVAALLTLDSAAQAEQAPTALDDLCRRLHVVSLSRHGLAARQIPFLIEKAKAASSMKANPIPLTAHELTEVVERAL